MAYTPGVNGVAGAAATITPPNASGATGGRLVVVVSLWSKGDVLATDAVPAVGTYAF